VRADFLLLLNEHLAFLLGYVRSLGFKRPDVEDIVQETLAGAYQNFSGALELIHLAATC
jgi:DNA-directed RNA polymerase specialized sigma24 family protein